jgi:hypothetical protein
MQPSKHSSPVAHALFVSSPGAVGTTTISTTAPDWPSRSPTSHSTVVVPEQPGLTLAAVSPSGSASVIRTVPIAFVSSFVTETE